jgi:stearoyl-CoA desaturase (delta-9 desaturase)
MTQVNKLKRGTPSGDKAAVDSLALLNFRRWLRFDTWDRRAHHSLDLGPVLQKDPLLRTIYSMGHDLSQLWLRSTASADQLLEELREWCQRAEASGIDSLRTFSREIVRLA